MAVFKVPKGLQGLGEIVGEEEPVSLLDVTADGASTHPFRPRLALLRGLVRRVVEDVEEVDALQRALEDVEASTTAGRARLAKAAETTLDEDNLLGRTVAALDELASGLLRMRSYFDIEGRPEYLMEGLTQIERVASELEQLVAE